MAHSASLSLVFMVVAVVVQQSYAQFGGDCESYGGFCAYIGECSVPLLPMVADCGQPGLQCCAMARDVLPKVKALPKIAEEVIPERCAEGAGECNANCPIAIRQTAFNKECPAGQYCCVWL